MDINKVVEDINKLFGKGTVINFEDDRLDDIQVISSGSIALDIALGGGYPEGRIIEIYGHESSGKTTLALHAVANVQAQGKLACYLDNENAFDPFYAEKLGVNFAKDKFLFSQPSSGEDTFTIVEKLLKLEPGVIVVDSVAAMIPRAELEGDFGDSKMGLHARLMSQGMRKLVSKIADHNTLVIFINQTRDKIGVIFGDPTTTTGGNALKFYASQRLEVTRSSQIKGGSGSDEVTGNIIRVKVVKNKIAPPARKALFQITYGIGIDSVQEIVALGVEYEVIKKSGSWFSYGETKLGQGEPNVVQLFRDNPELCEEVKSKILEKLS